MSLPLSPLVPQLRRFADPRRAVSGAGDAGAAQVWHPELRGAQFPTSSPWLGLCSPQLLN